MRLIYHCARQRESKQSRASGFFISVTISLCPAAQINILFRVISNDVIIVNKKTSIAGMF